MTAFIKTIAGLVLMSWFGTSAYAQDYLYSHFDTRNGLPGSTIYSCSQDGDGFLWFYTDGGISRFDGKTFTNFNESDGLPANEVFGSMPDKKDRLWLFLFSSEVAYLKNGVIYNSKNTPLLGQVFFKGELRGYGETAEGDIIITGNEECFVLTNQDSLYKIPFGILTPLANQYACKFNIRQQVGALPIGMLAQLPFIKTLPPDICSFCSIKHPGKNSYTMRSSTGFTYFIVNNKIIDTHLSWSNVEILLDDSIIAICQSNKDGIVFLNAYSKKNNRPLSPFCKSELLLQGYRE